MSKAAYVFRLEISAGEVVARVSDPSGALVAQPEGGLDLAPARLEPAEAFAARLASAEQALTPVEIDTFGELLFRLIFPENVAQRLYEYFDAATRLDTTYLRIEMEFRASAARLAALPWENLRLPANGLFPGLRPGTDARCTLVRTRPFDGRRRPLLLRSGEALKIALAVAVSPAIEESHGAVDYAEVLQTLKNLAAARMDSPTPVIILPELIPATPAGLRKLLKDHQPHILHLIGHGTLNAAFPDGALHLVDETTGADLPTASSILAEAFDVHQPQLVILQACESAASQPNRPYSGLAAALAGAGIPGVLAVQYKISNSDAAKFAAALYAGLADSVLLDQAVQNGRKALLQEVQAGHGVMLAFDLNGGLSRAFFAPVFYLRAHSPDLFPRSSGEFSPEALADSLLGLPGVMAIDPAFCATVYADCRSHAGRVPLAPGLKTLPEQVAALTQAQQPPGDPELLAVFAATLRARLPLAETALKQALKSWLADNAAALTLNPLTLDSVAVEHIPKTGPPCLQITLERDPSSPVDDRSKEKFILSSRDGREGVLFGTPNESIPVASLPAAFGERLSLFRNGLPDPAERDPLILADQLWVEFYLPKDMLSRMVEAIPVGGEAIGQQYRVVVRSLDRWAYSMNYAPRWKPHWQVVRAALGLAAPDPLASPLDCTVLTAQPTPEQTAEVLLAAAKKSEVLGLAFEPDGKTVTALLDSGVPVAVWLRRSLDAGLGRTILEELLTGLPNDLRHLPDAIRQRRADKSPAGGLVLLWDDFDRGLGRDYRPVADFHAVAGDQSFVLE
jgi:hypothetical protein